MLSKAPAAKDNLNVTVDGLPTASTSPTGLADSNCPIAGSGVSSGGSSYAASPSWQTISLRRGATG